MRMTNRASRDTMVFSGSTKVVGRRNMPSLIERRALEAEEDARTNGTVLAGHYREILRDYRARQDEGQKQKRKPPASKRKKRTTHSKSRYRRKEKEEEEESSPPNKFRHQDGKVSALYGKKEKKSSAAAVVQRTNPRTKRQIPAQENRCVFTSCLGGCCCKRRAGRGNATGGNATGGNATGGNATGGNATGNDRVATYLGNHTLPNGFARATGAQSPWVPTIAGDVHVASRTTQKRQQRAPNQPDTEDEARTDSSYRKVKISAAIIFFWATLGGIIAGVADATEDDSNNNDGDGISPTSSPYHRDRAI